MTFARQHELSLAVRSGGHSFAGFGTGDGIVLDMSRMKGISVNPARKTLWAQPGVTTADLHERVQPFGLALPTGDTDTVGIGGLTLGGGMGFLVRKFGLAIDNLISVELVTADGRLIRASADEYPDLFWAVRGGGGNFGVITAFRYRLVPVGPTDHRWCPGPASQRGGSARLRGGGRQARPTSSAPSASWCMPPPLPFIPGRQSWLAGAAGARVLRG